MKQFLTAFAKLEFDKVKKHIQRYAVSDLGRELIEELYPSSSSEEIRYRLSLVSEMKSMVEAEGLLPLDYLIDVRTTLHRSGIENYVLSPEELRSLALVLQTLRVTQSFMQRRAHTHALLASCTTRIVSNQPLELNINHAIDEDGNVKDSASKHLGSIRRQIIERGSRLRSDLGRILKAVGEKDWLQDDIITTREGRMVIPIKSEHKNRVPGFIHSSSSSGATVFIEPTETLALNNDIRTLQFEEQREIDRILRLLTEQVGEAKESINSGLSELARLDQLQSMARHSVVMKGSEPKITDGRCVRLIQAYHPTLLERHKREEVVPLNVEIGDECRTIVITGPNAGGKSVAMKTVGLLAILAQSGCHIPASAESELPVFSEIFVEVGDEQSIENDLSSFSSHLTNLKLIVEEATRASLVLIDEIASGTDPTEGSAIAAAILERLTSKECTTIVTTHHGALKSFAYETSHVDNAAMEFDSGTLTPTYRFRLGIPGSSYAIEMAERIRFQDGIVRRARELRGVEGNKLESLLLELEERVQQVEAELAHVQRETNRQESLAVLYHDKLRSLNNELKQTKARAIDEAKSIIERANAIIEKTIRDIRDSSGNQEAVRIARNALSKEKADLVEQEIELEPSSDALEFYVGDFVKFKQNNTIGEVVAKLNEGYVQVLVGTMKLHVHGRDITHGDKASEVQRSTPGTLLEVESKSEIDLRGMYGDEAIQAIDRLFDSAILSGLHRVRLIHGKGTGVLRRRITEYLKSLPFVKSYRLGEWNEGGAGVTIVELL